MSRRSHAGGRTRHRAGGRSHRDNGRRPEPRAEAPRIPGSPGSDLPPRPPLDGPAPRPEPEPAESVGQAPDDPLRASRPESAAAIATPSADGRGGASGCTAPQLRRFIKSRAYVPLHELRRRFGINGAEDDVTAIDLTDRRVYVGLPPREGEMLGDLVRGGEVGFELSLDPRTPIVVGVYPMRPVPRP